jgi:large subunit ribosomal protein L22
MAPRKVRVIADAIRGRKVDEATAILSFIPRRAVKPVRKVLLSALDAAKKRGNFDVDELFVKAIFVDKGPVLRRGLARARGMTTRINKFTSHLTVVLGEKE